MPLANYALSLNSLTTLAVLGGRERHASRAKVCEVAPSHIEFVQNRMLCKRPWIEQGVPLTQKKKTCAHKFSSYM